MMFYKIIETKYIGPTNTKGSRVKAIDSNKNSITTHWLPELSVEDNHLNAANMLLLKIAAKNNDSKLEIVGMGSSVNGKGYSFTAERKVN